MIVPMRKLSLLIFYQDYQQFLGQLREKGVVHIHENKKRSAEDEELKQKLILLKRISELAKTLTKKMPLQEAVANDLLQLWENAHTMQKKLAFYQHVFHDEVCDDSSCVSACDILNYLEGKFKQLDQIDQRIASFIKDEAVYEPWGNLPTERLEGLKQAGWDLRFFTVPDRKYLQDWEDKFNAFIIKEEKGQKFFITVMPTGSQDIPEADTVLFPSMNVEQIKEQIDRLRCDKEEIDINLSRIASFTLSFLADLKIQLFEDSDVLKINDTTQAIVEDKVIFMEGWIPESEVTEVDGWLKDKGVAYDLQKPEATDNPPILLKNNKFTKLFEFIGELYSLPNYRELDLTPFFAPFFVLFFGFCLGDAGYGLLILLGVTLYKLKAKEAIKPVLSLAQWLGFSTVVMGLVGGTFFGVSLLDAKIAWLEKFKTYMCDSQELFNLALIIGVVQILFGMFLKVANLWKQYGISAALSTIGWLVGILGGGACYWLSLQGCDVTILSYIVAIVAGLLIFVFNNVHRNVFINIGSGLWDSYNMVTGLLGDTLSYIRLFALGISSAVLGLVFNDLAMNMSGDIPVLKQLIMLIILVFGHGVNLFMAGLGSFVHPMRLTFVEFYKNAGFEGGGKKYQPFKKR